MRTPCQASPHHRLPQKSIGSSAIEHNPTHRDTSAAKESNAMQRAWQEVCLFSWQESKPLRVVIRLYTAAQAASSQSEAVSHGRASLVKNTYFSQTLDLECFSKSTMYFLSRILQRQCRVYQVQQPAALHCDHAQYDTHATCVGNQRLRGGSRVGTAAAAWRSVQCATSKGMPPLAINHCNARKARNLSIKQPAFKVKARGYIEEGTACSQYDAARGGTDR